MLNNQLFGLPLAFLLGLYFSKFGDKEILAFSRRGGQKKFNAKLTKATPKLFAGVEGEQRQFIDYEDVLLIHGLLLVGVKKKPKFEKSLHEKTLQA